MHIRCKSCHGTIWVEPPDSLEPVRSSRCKSCAQDYSFDGLMQLRSGARRLASDARKLAETHGIDLPGAYSVLFGIMTPDEVLELGKGGSTATLTTTMEPEPQETETTAAEPEEIEGRQAYDRAFQPAIDAGLLSTLEATRRGQRTAYAEAIVRRHELPMGLALEIADNRKSLLTSLRERKNDVRAEIVASVPRGPGRYLGWAAAGLAVVSVSLYLAYASPGQDATVLRDMTVLGAEVRMDDRGHVVRVAATTPKAVLGAYCASLKGTALLEPVGIIPSTRGEGESRLGLFRERARRNRLYSFDIMENRAAGRWIAGDGRSPIPTTAVPPGVLAEEKIPGSPG